MFPPMTLRAEGGKKVDVEAQAGSIEQSDQLLLENLQKLCTRLKEPDYLREEFERDFWQQAKQSEVFLEKSAIATVFSRSKWAQLPQPDRYYLKAMNCPHHHKLFGAVPRSYRDLPLRLAEYGTCYRYEQSGELIGLMRVRSMQMNDAHIYMTPEQFETEFNAVNEMYLKYFKLFGIEKYLMRFSTHDPSKLGQKFVDEPELWKQTEVMTRNVLKNSGINYVEVPNEAAFYAPKIDVQAWSVIGREFSIATNQVDFAQPRRFHLVYKKNANTKKTPLCIHRAPLGTHERFIGFLIDHSPANFPPSLSPDQVRILTT